MRIFQNLRNRLRDTAQHNTNTNSLRRKYKRHLRAEMLEERCLLAVDFRVWTQNTQLRPSSADEEFDPALPVKIASLAALAAAIPDPISQALAADLTVAATTATVLLAGIEAYYEDQVQNTDYDNEERTDRILERLEPFDIVALQELFDENQIDQIEAGATSYQAFYGPGQDVFEIPGPYPDEAWGANSGLGLLVHDGRTNLQHLSFPYDNEGDAPDSFSNKGFTIDKVQLGGPDEYAYVVNTHLYAPGSGAAVRREQLMQLAAEVGNLDARHPVLLMGDFNIAANSSEYYQMLSILDWPDDPFGLPGCTTNVDRFETDDTRDELDPNSNPLLSKGNIYNYLWNHFNEDTNTGDDDHHQRLDYVLVKQGTEYKIVPNLDANGMPDVRMENTPIPVTQYYRENDWYTYPQRVYLSDHYGLSANLRLDNTITVTPQDRDICLHGSEGNDRFDVYQYNSPDMGSVVAVRVQLGSTGEEWNVSFPVGDVHEITLETGNGNDDVYYRTDIGTDLNVVVHGGRDVDSVYLDSVAAGDTITIDSGDGQDYFRVRKVGSGAHIHIDAGDAGDRLRVGYKLDQDISLPRREMLGSVTYDGGGGENEILVTYAEDFDVFDDRLEHTNGGRIEHSNVAAITLDTYFGDQDIRIHGNRDDVNLTVNEYRQINPSFPTDTGRLTVWFAPNTRDLSPLAGDVTVNGVGLDGRVIVYDSAYGGDRNYGVGTEYRDLNGIDRRYTTIAVSTSNGPQATLAFESFRDFTLNSTGGDAGISVDRLIGNSTLTINAGNHDDHLYLTPSRLDFIDGHFVFVGGNLFEVSGSAIQFNAAGGANQLQLDDRFAADANRFEVRASEVLVGQVYDPNTGQTFGGDSFGYSGAVDVGIYGGGDNDIFLVPRFLASRNIELNGRGGDDRFEIGYSASDPTIDRNLEGNIRAHLTLDGGADVDSLVINDQDGGGGDYVVFADRFVRQSGLFPVTPAIDFEELDRLKLTTSAQSANRVRIDGFDGDIDLNAHSFDTINLGDGADGRFGGRLERIHGVIDIQAPINAQLTLNAFDQNDSGDDVYELTFGQFVKHQASGDVTVKYPLLSVAALTLYAGAGGNRIDVHGNAAVDTTINAGGGDDTIRIAPTFRDPSTLLTPIVIDGQGGVDTLQIFDDGDDDQADYTINGAIVDRNGGWSLDVGKVDIVELRATDGQNSFHVNFTPAGTEYRLFGNAGKDEFLIDAAGLNSDVAVRGGLPGGTPGDSLSITGGGVSAGTFTPGASGAGEFLVDSQSVSFTGIERPVSVQDFQQFTLVADNRLDDLWVRYDGAGWTSVSDESSAAAGPGLVRFSDVATFVVDGSAIDVNSDWTVEAGALAAAGLSTLELRTGSKLTIIADRVLEGPPPAATLAVRNLAGGATQHLIYGTPPRLDVELRDHQGEQAVAVAEIVARDANQDALYRSEDEGVSNVFVIRPQADVVLGIDGSDARLSDGGAQLLVSGAGLTRLWVPPAADGRLRVLPRSDMTIEIVDTVFPRFEFAPIFDLDVSPLGTFHVFPVNSTRFIEDVPLEQAVLKANEAPGDDLAVVFFAIPALDSGFRDVDSGLTDGDVGKDAFVITPAFTSALFRDNTILNGASQQLYTGDTNPFGPEIVLDGNFASNNALRVISDENIIHGLAFHSFNQAAVVVGGRGNTISHNYIGVDPTGMLDRGNGGEGVLIVGGGQDDPTVDNVVTDNLISGNEAGGVAISGDFAFENVVSYNRIGSDRTGTGAIANSIGVDLRDAQANVVENNLVSGNEVGIQVSGLFSGGNLIRGNLVGTNASGVGALGNTAEGVVIDSGGGNGVWGNVISGNVGSGIQIQNSSGNVILGNSIGVASDGATALGNADGIVITNSTYNYIGGGEDADRNVISASRSGSGVLIQGAAATGNQLQGNYIGTDVTGTLDRGNARSGVRLQDGASYNLVGGSTLGEGNLISGNGQYGVETSGLTASNNTIAGNLIGTDKSGMLSIANGTGGVELTSADNTIGGITAAARNVISGNLGPGVSLQNAGATGNRFLGNYVGVDVGGNRRLGNSLAGIVLLNAPGNVFGGSAANAANVVSGNGIDGILMAGNLTGGNEISGNLIGTGVDGETPLGNGRYGVWVVGGAHDNVIGTNGDGADDQTEGNTIAYSGLAGVAVETDISVDNTVRGNSIYGNGGIGIDLRGDGITENDLGDPNAHPAIPPDADSGPNLLQNFPTLSTARTTQNTRVAGRIHSSANTALVIDFYASPAADVEGFRQGARWIGSRSVMTNALGDAGFSAVVELAEVGELITATATDSQGNTSEFSMAVEVRGPAGGSPGGNGNGGENGNGGGHGNGSGPGSGGGPAAVTSPSSVAATSLQISSSTMLVGAGADASSSNDSSAGTDFVIAAPVLPITSAPERLDDELLTGAIESVAIDPARRGTRTGAADGGLESAYTTGVDAFFSKFGDPRVARLSKEL